MVGNSNAVHRDANMRRVSLSGWMKTGAPMEVSVTILIIPTLSQETFDDVVCSMICSAVPRVFSFFTRSSFNET